MNFKLTIRKKCGPSKAWNNTYHFQVDDAVDVTDAGVDGMITALVNYEKGLHLVDVNFLSATVSKVTAPGTTRTPADFKTVGLSGAGTVDPGGAGLDNLPKNLCIKVTHNAASGRSGSCLYRRALAAGYWQDNSGEPVFSSGIAASLQGTVDTLISTVSSHPLVLLPEGAGPDTEGRVVTSATVVGIFHRDEDRVTRNPRQPQAEGVLQQIEHAIELLVIAGASAQALKATGKWIVGGGLDAVAANWTAVLPILEGVLL